MKQLKFKIHGFTLIEVTVGIAVFALVMIAASGIFMSVQDGWQKQKKGIDAISNVRWGAEFMVNEMRQGTGFIIAGSGSNQVSFTLSGGTIWYWRGNTASDTTSAGDRSYLYRGTGTFGNAYANRQQLANFITDNPSGNSIFTLANGTIRIELTANASGKPYTVRTAVLQRNP